MPAWQEKFALSPDDADRIRRTHETLGRPGTFRQPSGRKCLSKSPEEFRARRIPGIHIPELRWDRFLRRQNAIKRAAFEIPEDPLNHHANESPELWFTCHVYHKSPDWIRPTISGHLNIP